MSESHAGTSCNLFLDNASQKVEEYLKKALTGCTYHITPVKKTKKGTDLKSVPGYIQKSVPVNIRIRP